MAFDGKHSLEAARAAALAAHSAAGLASAAGLRTAARLLRSSEALARAAIAALQEAALQRVGSPHAHSGGDHPRGGGAASAGLGAPLRAPGVSPASRPRRRRHKKKVVEKDEKMDACPEVMPLASLVGVAPALSADASVFVPGARPPRVLAARPSRERTPPPRASSRLSSTTVGSSAAIIADTHGFTVGCAVVFAGLVSRAELAGRAGTVLSFDEASSRYAIKVDATGESVRVLAKNLKPSIFVAGGGVT